jgi:tRNA G10  N-methylase Trm11
MPKFFFEAGSFKDLSYAEFLSVLSAYGFERDKVVRFSDKIFLIQDDRFSKEIGLKIFNRLGGFIRFGEVIENLETFMDFYVCAGQKVVYGISVLDSQNSFNVDFVKNLSRSIKENFKNQGISSRFIDSRNKYLNLNSAQVRNNKILEKGFELCLIDNETEKIYGKTLEIQNVDLFAARDEGKPYTDTDMGTLPPKLARMMVNLTGLQEGRIWDPFCGSGTILLEAAVLGFDVIGSDISQNAVYYAEQNLLWLEEANMIGDIKYNVFPQDITKVPKKTVKDLKDTSIDAVVCEPYMGPPQRKLLSPQKADELLEEVKTLYVGFFEVVEKVLRRDDIAVIVFPSYKTYKGWKSISIREIIGKRWNILNSELSTGRDLKWSRKNSIITRNIFVLSKR